MKVKNVWGFPREGNGKLGERGMDREEYDYVDKYIQGGTQE